MDFESIRKELAAILEVPIENVSDESPLNKFENWDSISKITLIAIIIDKTGRSINIDAFNDISTVSELRALVHSHEKSTLS